jgi:hypothetical protein
MTPSRRSYWLSMAALVVALPAALAVQCWGSVMDWRADHERRPISAVVGQPIDYAAASWTVTRFAKLPGREGRAVVLAEFQAAAPDPHGLSAVPCNVWLSDGAGREWRPTLFPDPVIRTLYPEAARKSLCGGPAFAAAEPGKPAMMVASFIIPVSARDLALSIALYSELPNYLNVSEPRN